MPTRPRDSQRSALYTAEHVAFNKMGEPEFQTVAQCQEWLDTTVLQSRWFQSRWGRRTINIRWGRGTHASGSTITMARWSRSPVWILHELGHCLTPSSYAWHGREYAGIYVALVEQYLGAEASQRLRDAFRTGGRKVRWTTTAVPAAGTHNVRTKSDVIEHQRRIDSRPLTPAEVTQAVEVIKRAARQGVFGPAGRKPRQHALATARLLKPV